jgi:hypothetical protein
MILIIRGILLVAFACGAVLFSWYSISYYTNPVMVLTLLALAACLFFMLAVWYGPDRAAEMLSESFSRNSSRDQREMPVSSSAFSEIKEIKAVEVLSATPVKEISVRNVRLKFIGRIAAFLVLFGAAYGLIWFGSEYAGAIESWISTASIVVGTLCAVAAFSYRPWGFKS